MARPHLRTLLRHIHHLAGPCAAAELSDRDLLERFAVRREEAAFAALVQRHGPLVLNVCRRLLHQEQDAEDVFQATFLVLARKAGSVRWRDSVAPWLHAVAHRLALKARAEALRRQRHEREAAAKQGATAADDLSWREATALLEEELGRLPERYRAPLLLCCWEGKARDEAARLLGWTAGTLKGQLERGRELLRRRLARRGVALSAGLLAVGLARGGVPAALADATVRVALAAATGAAGAVPASVAVLADAALKALTAAKVKVTGVLLGVVLLATGAGVWTTQQAWATRPVEEATADEAPPDPPERGAGDEALAAAPPEKAPEDEKPPEEKPPAALPWPRADLEGVALPPGAVQRFGTTRLLHAGAVRQVAFSPDGKMLASAAPGDEWVHLWEAATGKELHQLSAPNAESLAFSPDGKRLAVVRSSSGAVARAFVCLWDTKSGKDEGFSPAEFGRPPHLLSFSTDGTRLYAFADGKTAEWDVKRGIKLEPDRVTNTLGGLATAVVSGVGPKDSFRAVATRSGIAFTDERTGKDLGLLKKENAEFTALAFADNVLAAGTAKGEIVLWEVNNGKGLPKELRTWHASNGGVMALALSASKDDVRLTAVSVATDVEVRVWNAKKPDKELSKVKPDGLPTYKAAPPPGKLPHFVLSPDGKRLAVADRESQRLWLWDTATGKELFAPSGHERAVRQVAFLADGKTVASVGTDGTLLLWPVGSEERPRRTAGLRVPVDAVTLSRDGKAVAVVSYPQPIEVPIEVRDTATGKVVSALDGPPDERVLALAFAPDGKSLAVGTPAGVRLWPLADKSSRLLGTGKSVTPALAFSADGWLLAADERHGSEPDDISLWDVVAGKKLRTLVGPNGTRVQLLAFDAEGKVLAAAAEDGDTVTLYNVETGGVVRRCRRAGARLHSLAFARAGRLLVAGDGDGLTLWETATGAEVLRLTGHLGAVNSVAVSPDGNRLVSGSADTTALLWDLPAAWKETAPALPKGKEPPGPEDLWSDLGRDAATAYRAVSALAADRERALPLLKRELLGTGGEPGGKRVKRLVADLDDADPKVRDRALRELRRVGATAEPALRKALREANSDKLRARLRGLLTELEADGVIAPADDNHLVGRAVQVLELVGTDEARKLLEALARDGRDERVKAEAKAALDRAKRAKSAP
jgi:RNA polymerase sigma factor (sigma-70 family)